MYAQSVFGYCGTCCLGSDVRGDFWVDICLRKTRLWYVRAIWVQILQKTLLEECISEINVRQGLLVCGVHAILRPDVTLDFGHGVCILRVFWAPDIAGEFKWVHLYVMGDHLG